LLRGRLVLEWTLVVLVATVIVILAAASGFTTRFDNLLYDRAAVWRSAPPSDDILIVEIDTASLAALGKWPWTRDIHARLISELSKARPKVIANDILFIEPSPQDPALATAMRSGTPVVLPLLYTTPGSNGAEQDINEPVEPLKAAAAGLGTVNLIFDEDGLVRRAQLETRTDGRSWPHLMELTYRLSQGRQSPVSRKQTQTSVVDPQDDSILVPMRPAGSFRHVSFSTVLAGEVPAGFLTDKIILIGATADGMGDRYPVAVSAGSTMSGIEIQANLLNALLSNRIIERAPLWASILASLVPIWFLMLGFLRWKPNTNLLASIGLITAVIASSILTAIFFGFWLSPGPALLGLLLVYPLWGWRRLEALNAFVGQVASDLHTEPGLELVPAEKRHGLDSVASRATELSAVIGALRGVRQFMSDVITGFPDAICIVDKELRVTLANRAAEDVLGSQLLGQKLQDLIEVCAPGTLPDAPEIKDLKGRTFLIRQAQLSQGLGENVGAIVRFVDISRLRADEFEREEMLEFLSHDMRAPQAAILSLTEGVEETDTLRSIRRNARKTLKLADGFVQHARLSSTELVMEETNLAAALAEAIDAVWPQAKRKRIKLDVTGADWEAFMMGDAASLVRALTNLVDNAVKYSPSGSTVTCALVVEAPLTGGTELPHIRCSIIDQGTGLPAGRIDNPYLRFGPIGGERGGAGLGLAYVKQVVDRHGGTIDCISSPEHGTRFTLTFAGSPLVSEQK
jgi:CHASE2 domain-containing sensor protein/signal transduction histidine kinase